MDGSRWERLGERLGYGLASVVFGPRVALERRAQRAMRAALRDFCTGREIFELTAPRGILRRLVVLGGRDGPTSAEVELDLGERRARVAVAFQRPPACVDVVISKAADLLLGVSLPSGPPLATAGAWFVIDGPHLDIEDARALVTDVAGGPLDVSDAAEIALTPERIELFAVAPTTSAGWAALADGVMELAICVAHRFPPAYR